MTHIRTKLHNPQQAHAAITSAYQSVKPWLMAGRKFDLTVKPDTRTAAQNRLMWDCLTALSEQVLWFGKRLTEDGWKDFITGHLHGQELVPNMDGTGFISLNGGRSTSSMTIGDMNAVIELALSFGAREGVRFKIDRREEEPA